MIVRIFKTSQPSAMLAIPLIGLILRLGVFFKSDLTGIITQEFMPHFHWIYDFNLSYPVTSGLLSWFIVSLQALYFNFIIEEQSILPRKNYLLGFLYITLFSYFPEYHYLSAATVSGCLILPAFHKILLLSKQNSSINHAFDSALLAGCSALIYLPTIIFYVIIFIALIYFKSIKLRLWILSFIGLILPFIFLTTYLYWHGEFEIFWNNALSQNLLSNPKSGIGQLKFVIPLIPILLISIPKYFNGSRGTTVRVKHIYALSIWLITLSIFIPVLFAFNSFAFIFIALLGCSLFIAYYFYYEKRNWLTDVNYLFLFISVIYINYLL